MTSHVGSCTRRTAALLIGFAMIIAACGSANATTESGGAAGRLSLEDLWTRPTAPGAQSTAFYVIVNNTSGVDDHLVSAESESCVSAEFHQTSQQDGVMTMRPATPQDLNIAAADQLILAPGGLHIMCMGLTGAISEGDTVKLTLNFEQAGAITELAKVESP